MAQFIGKVIGTKMQKTAKVEVIRMFLHPQVLKYVRKRKTFFAHDENEQCQVGDLVKIKECRPISRKKHFTVVEIVEHGPFHATLSCDTHTQEPTCTSETPHKPTPTQGINHTAPSSGTHTQAPT